MSDIIKLNDEELLRYARQILLDDWDIETQLNIKNSRVLIIGMGGLGCPVAQILVRAGVGNIHLIDDDVIEISNLQRQVLYDDTDIGQYKAKIAHKKLAQHNPFIQITHQVIRLDKDNIAEIFDKCHYDLVLDCSDNFMIRDLINHVCVQRNIALLSASAIGYVGQLLLFDDYINDGCYRCVFDGEMSDDRTCSNNGVLASTVAVMGALQAQAALMYLGKCKNILKGELLLYQGQTLSQKKIKYQKNLNCPECQSINKSD